MKYTIYGFNQKKVIEEKLDVSDLVILRWIADLSGRRSTTKKLINETTYVWVKYSVLLSDLPILDIKKRALQLRLERLTKKGLILHYHDKEKGSFSYYALTDKYDELIYENSEDNVIDCTGGVQSNAHQRLINTRLINECNIVADLSENAKHEEEPMIEGMGESHKQKEEKEDSQRERKVPRKEREIEEREREFTDKVNQYKGKYGEAMITAFLNYWLQSDGKKLWFERQKMFDVGRRLATWASKDYNKPQAQPIRQSIPDIPIWKKMGCPSEEKWKEIHKQR